MRKLIYLVSFALVLVGCSSSNTNSNSGKYSMSTNPTKLSPSVESAAAESSVEEVNEAPVGGWAPVFFSWMDTKQLDSISSGMNEGRIRRVMISYPPKMQTLANKIQAYLQNQTKQQVNMESIELKDTEQVSYNITQVIVTVYFK